MFTIVVDYLNSLLRNQMIHYLKNVKQNKEIPFSLFSNFLSSLKIATLVKLRPNFRAADASVDLAFVGGRLFFYSSNVTAGHVIALNPNSFAEEDINLAQIRNSNPTVSESVKNNKITNTNVRFRITTDGVQLIAICETTNPGEKTGTVTRYWADFFNVVSSNSTSDVIITFVRRIELKGPDIDFPKNSHNGITCKGCHRMNFTLKRYKCKGK